MRTDCREDPCGECRYCRFERPEREADLPGITPAAAGVADPEDTARLAKVAALCMIGQSSPCGKAATHVIAVTKVADHVWATDGRVGGVVSLCHYHAHTPASGWES